MTSPLSSMAIGRVDNITNISVLNPNVLPYNRAETLIPFRDKWILEILAFTAPGASNVRSEMRLRVTRRPSNQQNPHAAVHGFL